MFRFAKDWALALALLCGACSVVGSSLDGYAGGECPDGLQDCGGQCLPACVEQCEAGEELCDTECADLTSNDQHCGKCGNACAVGQACSAGQCEASCTAEQTECSGTCVDTKTSILHCGACDNACPTGEACINSACQILCPGGQVECSGLCIDLNNNNLHCGACDAACAAGEVCANGSCALSCPPGQTECGSTCVDLESDPSHCGACDAGCSGNEECTSGQCTVACKTMLNQPLDDPWGYSWDGLERAPSTYDVAESTCSGLGARLPTATELYRVSATQSATVGQSIHTNNLWSLVPYDASQQVRVRLSDGATGGSALTGSLNYRCVCPPPPRNDFSGHYCNGTPGQGCVALGGDGNKYNIDAQDRAPLHKAGAIWECTFYRAHLPSFGRLAEAVMQGVPNGSGSWLNTGDDARYDRTTLIRWTGTGTGFALPTDGNWSTFTSLRPFRCVGTSFDPGPNPNAVAGEFVGPTSDYKSETNDTAAAAWGVTQDECYSRGGHLPTAVELAELLQEGLPNGGGNQVRTADGTGSNGTNHMTQVMLWTGAAPRYGYVYPGDLTWASRTGSRGYRCIYYPIDTAYTGPPDTDCSGGCTALFLPGTPAPTMWFDNFDRVPATWIDAVKDCQDKGGHLPSERDFTEAIRQGLPNGADVWLHTSDTALGQVTTNVLRDQLVRWVGVNKTWSGIGSPLQSWGTIETVRAYRCMWTNELR